MSIIRPTIKSILILSFCLITTISFGVDQKGKIIEIMVKDDGLHYFLLEGTRELPKCAKAHYWVIKDETSVAGQTQISLLLTAYATNKMIKVDSAISTITSPPTIGTCFRDTALSKGEDVGSIKLEVTL